MSTGEWSRSCNGHGGGEQTDPTQPPSKPVVPRASHPSPSRWPVDSEPRFPACGSIRLHCLGGAQVQSAPPRPRMPAKRWHEVIEHDLQNPLLQSRPIVPSIQDPSHWLAQPAAAPGRIVPQQLLIRLTLAGLRPNVPGVTSKPRLQPVGASLHKTALGRTPRLGQALPWPPASFVPNQVAFQTGPGCLA